MFNWNDLRYLLAVAREGSTLAAARALGVNQSTVHRRLAELEGRLRLRLFQRRPSGYRLTEAGESVLRQAVLVETAVAALEQQVRSMDEAASGVVRLTCPEPLVARISRSELLTGFHARYPQLRIEFVMSDRYLDLRKGEADVALRSGEPEDTSLVGRRVGASVWAVYASPDYVQRHGKPHEPADLAHHQIVAYEGALADHRAARWLASVAPEATIAASNNSVLGILHAVRSGLGVAPLPTTIADAGGDLVQVLPPVPELERGWYLLTDPDIRQTPRVRAFFDYVQENLAQLRSILMG